MAASLLGGSVVGPSPARDMYIPRVGSFLSPRLIARIMIEADAGYPARWHDLLNEVKQKDPPLLSTLQTRETALMARGWTIAPWKKPGADKAEALDHEIADFCKGFVGEIENLPKSLAHLLDANYKAYSICEIGYEKRDGSVVPARLTPIHGRRWRVTTEQRLVFYDDGLVNPPLDVLGDSPQRFIVHLPRINGDSLSREGLGRTVIWFAAFANWGWRDWMLFAEMFGQPRQRVEYDPETYQGDTATDIEEAMQRLQASGFAIFPKGAHLITEWPGGSGSASNKSPSPDIIDKSAKYIALAVIGQQATIAEVTNGLGGKGDARDLVRRDIMKADDLALSESVRRQLLMPAVRAKFGPKAQPSLFGFDVEDPVDVKAFAEGISTLAPLIPIGRKYVYEATGIPEPTDGEAVLDKPATPAPAVSVADPTVEPATGPTGTDAPTGPEGPTGP